MEALIFVYGNFRTAQVNHKNFLLQPTIHQMVLCDTNLKIHNDCCQYH